MARGQDEKRRKLLEGATGDVVEVGAGHGLNFPFYPATVSSVTAVEPEAVLRRAAQAAAVAAPVPITVIDGLADHVPVPDAAFDVGVASLVLCSVADAAAALAELHRVIRPGGQLRFYEHVAAESPRFARRQRRFDPVWARFAGGCHLDRDTAASIASGGFEIDRIERFFFSTSFVDRLAAPHILGVATRR